MPFQALLRSPLFRKKDLGRDHRCLKTQKSTIQLYWNTGTCSWFKFVLLVTIPNQRTSSVDIEFIVLKIPWQNLKSHFGTPEVLWNSQHTCCISEMPKNRTWWLRNGRHQPRFDTLRPSSWTGPWFRGDLSTKVVKQVCYVQRILLIYRNQLRIQLQIFPESLPTDTEHYNKYTTQQSPDYYG